jgi:hypothetical protein
MNELFVCGFAALAGAPVCIAKSTRSRDTRVRFTIRSTLTERELTTRIIRNVVRQIVDCSMPTKRDSKPVPSEA